MQYEYDAANQLSSVIQANHPDPAHNRTTYAYDVDGKLKSWTDANSHTTLNGYDLLNQLSSETLPGGGPSQTRTYDPAGNLLTLRDYNGNTSTYTYDEVNRLKSKTPDASLNEPAVTFTYTKTGKREMMIDSSGQTTCTYDAMDRLKTKVTPQGTLNYGYDAAGNLTSMSSLNANGISVNYTYDEVNRLKTVVDNRLPNGQNTTTYSYDPASNLATVTYPNGIQSTFVYDSLNRLKSVPVQRSGSTVATYGYNLGPTGNRSTSSESNGRFLTWTYDGIYRLTSETISSDPAGKNGTVGYGLDPVGNRLSLTSTLPGIATASYSYDANDRILSTENYDPNGNTTLSGGRGFAYDFENRLKSMNNGAVTLVYDGDGNRVAKTVGGVTTRYLVDDLNPTGYAQVVEELVGGAVQREYTYGFSRISQTQASGTRFYSYDGMGSVRLLTDAAGAVTDRFDYDAWGNTLMSSGPTPNVFRYRGEQYDADLNLYYLRARYFNPVTGRFLTRDPEFGNPTDPRTIHKYLYVAADPINGSDPNGRAGILDYFTPMRTIAWTMIILTVHDAIIEAVECLKEDVEALLKRIEKSAEPGVGSSSKYSGPCQMFHIDKELPEQPMKPIPRNPKPFERVPTM